MKALITLIFVATILLAAGTPVVANNERLDEEMLGRISQNCASIQVTLRQLAIIDERVRSRLGGRYGQLIGDFMMPLSIRLTVNNLPVGDLSDKQVEFSRVRSEFNQHYTYYRRGLDELINFNCRDNPSGFYRRLGEVRALRVQVQAKVVELDELAKEYMGAVREIEL